MPGARVLEKLLSKNQLRKNYALANIIHDYATFKFTGKFWDRDNLNTVTSSHGVTSHGASLSDSDRD